MAARGFFGEYNNIYFLTDGGKITALCDRAHRKQPISFMEGELEDLAAKPREVARFHLGSSFADWLPEGKSRFPNRRDTRRIEIGGREFTVTGQAHRLDPSGFGLGLKYQVVIPDHERTAVLLTVKLPELVRYQMRWEPLSSEGPHFTLPENMLLTVLTDLSWRFEDSTFTAETGPEPGEVTYLVESCLAPSRVQDTVIVAAEGREREALLVRAACGRGFVPCFVLGASQCMDDEPLQSLLADVPHCTVLSIGLSPERASPESDVQIVEVDVLDDSLSEILRLLGQEPCSQTLIAPDCQEAYGPALLLALHHDANLRFDDIPDGRLSLIDASGHCIHQWLLKDLLGSFLSFVTTSEQSTSFGSDRKEVVVCESTATDLLVCQAVGYADLKGCPIAFLPPIEGSIAADGFPDGVTGLQILEAEAARAVPFGLLTPDADTLTIFTCHLPLHLTPLPGTGDTPAICWRDRYTLAHLPGQVASRLVPVFFQAQMQETPPAPFAVIFDALGQVTGTEGDIYAEELKRGLSHPIMLSARQARHEMLREILQRLDTDFVLLITHGGGDSIEDGARDTITSAEIATWDLRGSPVVFNNSCTSWATTGTAFLKAGARGIIGSLWPISNDIAARIAARVGARLHTEESDVPTLLKDALLEVATAQPDARETAAAYLYVGLPGTQLLTRPPINAEETAAFLAETFQALYSVLGEIVMEGRPDLAIDVQQVTGEALRRRFKALLIPGELPPSLPWPMAQYSALDIDFLLAAANFGLCQTILTRLSHELQRGVVAQMDDYLRQALRELVTWDERHDKHLGRTEMQRDALVQQIGIPARVLGEMGFYELAARMTIGSIIPFIAILADLGEEEAARSWLSTAAKLVVTPDELSSDGSVADEALIRRISEGVHQQMRAIAVNGGTETQVSIDILQDAVNKSELANRFGVACLHLKDYERAVSFFEAARDLAEPGTDHYANAVSNLSNALREIRTDEALDGYKRAFMEQERLEDYRNAMTTTANMLRVAIRNRQSVDEESITKALAWADALTLSSERVRYYCDLLGAAASYYASHGKHDLAAEACAQISRYLEEPFPVSQVAVHLNELVEWYYEVGLYSKAVRQALANAASLQRAQLPDTATRTYALASECALQAYNSSRKMHFLGAFLDCSQQIGRALRLHPNLRGELGDIVEHVWENTQSLLKQLGDRGERALALKAYMSAKAWDPTLEDPAWELLANALHPLNKKAIRTLATNGAYLREATLTIGSNLSVIVEKTTRREDGRSAQLKGAIPETVYGYWPCYPKARPLSLGGAKVAAGSAVYSLRDGESITIREELFDALRAGGSDTFFYQQLWGSRLIPYRLVISLAKGLVPLIVEVGVLPFNLKMLKRFLEPRPEASIRFHRKGCLIEIVPRPIAGFTTQYEPWLQEIRMMFKRTSKFGSVFYKRTGPFAKEMSLERFMDLLKRLPDSD